jgi:hypothetical protein
VVLRKVGFVNEGEFGGFARHAAKSTITQHCAALTWRTDIMSSDELGIVRGVEGQKGSAGFGVVFSSVLNAVMFDEDAAMSTCAVLERMMNLIKPCFNSTADQSERRGKGEGNGGAAVSHSAQRNNCAWCAGLGLLGRSQEEGDGNSLPSVPSSSAIAKVQHVKAVPASWKSHVPLTWCGICVFGTWPSEECYLSLLSSDFTSPRQRLISHSISDYSVSPL